MYNAHIRLLNPGIIIMYIPIFMRIAIVTMPGTGYFTQQLITSLDNIVTGIQVEACPI
jgi:hypothetical protein